jgi:hypothetical protein
MPSPVTRPLSARPALLAVLALVGIACTGGGDPSAPRLPEGRAGEILSHAIAGAGGWKSWVDKRDAGFVSTTTISNPAAGTTSETLGLYRLPLHDFGKVRFDSLGLIEPVAVGLDGEDIWVSRDGRLVPREEDLGVPRFNVVSTAFWFGLPFRLAELPVKITDEGDRVEGDDRYSLLGVTLNDDAPETPGDRFVIWFDSRTGLIHHLVAHITAPFLAHRLWVGFWRDYRDVGGLRIERRRRFLPSDEEGNVVGSLVVDQLVEDVRFDVGVSAELFKRPFRGDHGQVASCHQPADLRS